MIERIGIALRPSDVSGGPIELEASLDALSAGKFESVWTGEAYGSDCFCPLAWYGARIAGVRLGTAVCQMGARSPTATAMAAATLDWLSGGRLVLGLGVSGPRVIEGWYGAPFEDPLQFTREYVSIVRQVIARVEPVEFDGRCLHLPYRNGSGAGKPLRLSFAPVRSSLPIYIGASGPRNIALAAEIGDGWLARNFSPLGDELYREMLGKGWARRASSAASFEVVAVVPVGVGSNLEDGADRVRQRIAFYVGAMGTATINYHRNALTLLGFGATCDEIYYKFVNGDKLGAAKAVTTDMAISLALVGSLRDIEEQLSRWCGTIVNTLVLQGKLEDCIAVSAVWEKMRDRCYAS